MCSAYKLNKHGDGMVAHSKLILNERIVVSLSGVKEGKAQGSGHSVMYILHV